MQDLETIVSRNRRATEQAAAIRDAAQVTAQRNADIAIVRGYLNGAPEDRSYFHKARDAFARLFPVA